MSRALRSVGSVLVFAILVPVTTLEVVRAACFGAFSQTCWNASLNTSSGVFTAYCLDENDSSTQSTVNLNDHVANIDGALDCNRNGGDFLLTCTAVSLLTANRLMATCLDALGDFAAPSSLDLNPCISNSNGFLKWSCLDSV
ncbi:hypothetical protein KP509_37G060200 [Ceratopteris richardii]|uniref:Cyanovirin-N domain-containing protein n=1 Tax=Ceratopteris richardii TaxID=49495 RepID=A0A8T2QAN0_CERRI|nr:hypothetical protein KP509_37G060200 [Ceratopteris richardii]